MIVASSEAGSIVRVPVTMHWLYAPLGLLFILPMPALIGSLLIPEGQFIALFGQPSFLDGRIRVIAVAYMIAILAVFIFMVPMRAVSSGSIVLDQRSLSWLNSTIRWLVATTLIAYIIWLGSAIARGLNASVVSALLSGEEGTVYLLKGQYFENFSGITTWMQLGALAAPLVILRKRATGKPAGRILSILIIAALVRALLNSERLALIEILLSTILASLILRDQAPRLIRKPVAAIVLVISTWLALLLTFGAFEYFRSWVYVSDNFAGGFWLYAATLLLGYYTTALNLAAFDGSMLKGDHLVAELFQGNIWSQVFGPSPLDGVQKAYGLQTFTNRSGLLVPEVAFGSVWGGVLMIATAVVLATWARRAAKGMVVSFAMYCCSAVAILELVRIYYFGSSRFLPVLIASAIMAFSWSMMRHRRASVDMHHRARRSVLSDRR